MKKGGLVLKRDYSPPDSVSSESWGIRTAIGALYFILEREGERRSSEYHHIVLGRLKKGREKEKVVTIIEQCGGPREKLEEKV